MDKSIELKCEISAALNAFSFGVIVNNNRFVTHFKTESDTDCTQINAIFQNNRKRVLLQFTQINESLCLSDSGVEELTSSVENETNPSMDWIFDKYEFVLNYSQIKSIHFNDNNLVFKLLFPPLLYKICKEVNNDFEDNSTLYECDSDCDQFLDEMIESNGFNTDYDNDLEETNDWLSDDMENESQVYNNHNCNDFSGSRLRVTNIDGFHVCEHDFTKINSIELELNQNLIKQITDNIKAFEPLIIISEDSFQYICKQSKANQILNYMSNGLDFNIEYSLQALIEYSYHLIDSLIVNNITLEELIQLIKQFCAINPKAVEYSLNDLQKKVENSLAMNPYFDLIESFIGHNVIKPEKWTNSSVMSVRRCVLTPTRLLLLPALPLQQSRFLRTCDPDYALRVLIKDEDLQLLTFSTCKTSLPDEHEFVHKIRQFLWKTIIERLENGISIGGRFYELIGASTSQLRDHGLVLYAKDGQQRSALNICQQIGTLTGITNPAKFISRIGLSMSQSMGFVSDVNCVETIPDITGGKRENKYKDTEDTNPEEPYIFSDGVGMISQAMAQKIMSVMNRTNYLPSAFQIRYAGIKGIVVLNPELEGERILIRPSMKKFDSSSTELDILKVSEPRSVYLNRPLITILNQMGVTDEQLLKLQLNRLKELSTAFSCNCKAIQLIKSYSTLKLPYNQILDSGIDVLSEPLFVNIMDSIIRKVCIDLRNKARILIPIDQGRVMYGVMDETQTLDYGQVFVQYSDEDNGSKKILSGEILVTKYPCMHAGDVRKLTAVDVPALHHIVDCIVFPSKGQRPHPDEMAGSDLDGDEYSVIWYKPFIFKRNNYDPMHFPCGEAKDLGRAVNTHDILKFYCDFIENNQVGIIASSHLAWADYNEAGIFSRLCNILDVKYAVALDYAKTGKNARLQNQQKPNRYPDFMMKYHEKSTYKSRNGLGKLYQTSCYFNDIIEDIAQQNTKIEILNEELVDENAGIYMNDAEVMFEMYKNSIIELKEQFGIESESALISGSFTKTHKYFCTQNDNNDVHDLVSNIINKLFNDFKIAFEKGVSDEMRFAKASAWYQISVKKNNENDDKYFGFPWIVSQYLAKLAVRKRSSKHDCTQYSIKVDQSLDNSMKRDKEIIQKLITRYVWLSFREKIFLGEDSVEKQKIDEYLKEVIGKVVLKSVDESDGQQFPVTRSIRQIFDELANNAEVFDNNQMVLKVGVIALMANYRVLKSVNIVEDLKQINKTFNNNLVLSVTISETLANIIQNNEQLFKSTIIKKTGVQQIDILFGRRGQDSSIAVYGHKCAVQKFRELIIHRYLCTEIKRGTFFY